MCEVPGTVGDAKPGQVDLGCVRKVTGQARGEKASKLTSSISASVLDSRFGPLAPALASSDDGV